VCEKDASSKLFFESFVSDSATLLADEESLNEAICGAIEIRRFN
jgi:hypothetical protein